MRLMFDLDGTLTDSRLGIARCIQHALAEAGVAVPPVDELTPYVGPPLPASFAKLLGTTNPQRIEGAIQAYRRRFELTGIFENRLYPGIVEAVTALAAAGHDMSVVTVKPRVYAVQILEHFEIASLFGRVYGPELDARDYTKASLIREACAGASTPAHLTIMIGDRAEDVHGARSNGVGSVAVAWGYGDREELETAGPDSIVASSAELLDYIRQAA